MWRTPNEKYRRRVADSTLLWLLLDWFAGVSGQDVFEEGLLVVLEDGSNDRGVVGVTGARARVEKNVGGFAQVKERECGLGYGSERDRPIQTGMEIFDDLCQEFHLVGETRELSNLVHREPNLRKHADELIQMRGRDPARTV